MKCGVLPSLERSTHKNTSRKFPYLCPKMSETPHKSGFVAIIGKPNAGKSTLLNAMLGRKLCITTPKAQTTRHRIIGIANGDDYQIVFSDTPGVIRPKYGLHKAMMGSVKSSMEDADLIVLIVDINEKFDETMVYDLVNSKRPTISKELGKVPVILAINKVDKADEEKARERYEEIKKHVKVVDAIGIAALLDFNVMALKEMILEHLPEGPAYYDKDTLSDRPERFFITEIIREKIFMHFKEEIPYSTEVYVLQYEEKENIDVIHAEIHVERKSQKGILIGKGGSMLKKIGGEARKDIEQFLQKRVYLDLHVRVNEGWRDNNLKLRGFGYQK